MNKGRKESCVVCIQMMEMRVLRSSVHVNSRRLRTLQEEVYKDEKLVSYLMQKERDDKYDFNQLRTDL